MRYREATRQALRRVASSKAPYRIATFAVLATAWELGARSAHSLLIPTFLGTMGGVVSLAFDDRLWTALIVSNQAMLLGFGISLALGIPLGLAMGRYPALERIVDVYLNILLVMPIAALIPILIMAVGIGLASRVILIILFAALTIIVNARTGVRQIDRALIDMATSFGASEVRIWYRILIPGAIPAIMSGVRIGIGRALLGMVVVELLMVSVGVGNLVLEFRGEFEPNLLYAVIVYVVIEALLLGTLARWFERRSHRWSSHGSTDFGLQADASR